MNEPNKVKLGWKRYADDYETTITTDEKGREKKSVIYRGSYYEVAFSGGSLNRFKGISLGLAAVTVILHVLGGFLTNRGMYQMYISLPYTASFFPLLFLVASVLRLPTEKRKYRRDEVGLSFERMKTSGCVLLAFLCLGLLGQLIFLFFIAGENANSPDYQFLALTAATTGVVLLLIRNQSRLSIHQLDKKPD